MDCGCHSRSAFSFLIWYYQSKMPVKRFLEIRRHQNKLNTSAICSYFLHFWQFSTFIPFAKRQSPKLLKSPTFKSGRTRFAPSYRGYRPGLPSTTPQSVRIGRSLISCIRLRPALLHAQLTPPPPLVRMASGVAPAAPALRPPTGRRPGSCRCPGPRCP